MAAVTSEDELCCGAYEGRTCLRDEEDGAVAIVNGQRIYEVSIDSVPDVLVSPSYISELRHAG